MTHIYVGKLTIIGSDNGLSPGRRQAIIWTNAGILLIEPLGTNFREILIEIQINSFKKMRLKMSSAKWRPFYFGLNVLITILQNTEYSRSTMCHLNVDKGFKGKYILCYLNATPEHKSQGMSCDMFSFVDVIHIKTKLDPN